MLFLVVLALALEAPKSRPSEAPLAVGAVVPRLEGETLSGERLAIPAKTGVAVFTFSKKAGESAAACVGVLTARDGTADFVSYRVLMLQGVPRLLRGLVVSGIKKGIPAPLHATTIKVFDSDQVWKERLDVRSTDLPHVVVFDTEGRLRAVRAGGCDESTLAWVRERLR